MAKESGHGLMYLLFPSLSLSLLQCRLFVGLTWQGHMKEIRIVCRKVSPQGGERLDQKFCYVQSHPFRKGKGGAGGAIEGQRGIE